MGHHHQHRPEEHEDPFAHTAHGAHLLHAGTELREAMHHHDATPMSGPMPTAPGSGGPHDPEYWREEITDRQGLSEVIDAVRPGAAEEARLAAHVPAREPISPDA